MRSPFLESLPPSPGVYFPLLNALILYLQLLAELVYVLAAIAHFDIALAILLYWQTAPLSVLLLLLPYSLDLLPGVSQKGLLREGC